MFWLEMFWLEISISIFSFFAGLSLLVWMISKIKMPTIRKIRLEGSMPKKIIVLLSDEDRCAGHVPDWVFNLCHNHDVFYEDHKTGELIQVLDMLPEEML